jgi:hypothetical protein
MITPLISVARIHGTSDRVAACAMLRAVSAIAVTSDAAGFGTGARLMGS